MQRSKVRGADLKPDPVQWSGTINAEKCIRYLRGIGVDIDDDTADMWLDAQGVHRFLQSEKRSVVSGQIFSCRCGAMQGFAETSRKARRKKTKDGKAPVRCEECGSSWVGIVLAYTIARDGSMRDYRPKSERWKPLEEYVKEMRALVTANDDNPEDPTP